MDKEVREVMSLDLDNLVDGKTEFEFFGAHGNRFKLNNMVLEALEHDSGDGEGTFFDCVVIAEEQKKATGSFGKRKAIVRVEYTEGLEYYESFLSSALGHLFNGDGFEGWKFVDVKTGHVWLWIGTDQSSKEYPCFAFSYSPNGL